MSWTTITENDVLAGLNASESSAYRTKLLGDGQLDPLLEITDQVVAEIRDAVRSNPDNILSASADQVPGSAKYHAVAIIRYRLITRLAGVPNESRRAEWDRANRWLDQVAQGRIRIESGATGTDTEAAAPGSRPRITAATRIYERGDAEGL